MIEMKTNILSLTVIAGTLLSLMLTACQPHDTVIVKESAQPAADSGRQGGVDGGGGNGIGNRPLESYRVKDRESIAEVKTIILPMLENLKKSFMPLAADL